MAVHDHDRRTARDYIHTRYEDTGSGFNWVGVAAFLFLIGFVLFIFLAAPSRDPTGGITRSSSTTTVPQSPNPSPTGPTTQPP